MKRTHQTKPSSKQTIEWVKEKEKYETETNREKYTNIIVFLRGISAHKKIIVISIISPQREKRKEYGAHNSHS